MDESARRGMLIVLSSPSGAGKTTLARKLIEWDSNIVFSVSATTRPPRNGEVDGREYCFKSRSQFNAMIEANELLEHAEVFGHLYGSPIAPVELAIRDSQDVIFDIDWQGGRQLRDSTHSSDTISIFVLPPTIAELHRRLTARGAESEDHVAFRMAKSRDEISHWSDYDYVLLNHDLDHVLVQIKGIIEAERLKRARRIGLTKFVNTLYKEYEERNA